MREIVLHGRLAKFGGPYRLEASTPADAIRALLIQLKGFSEALSEGSYRLIVGNPKGAGNRLALNDLKMPHGQKPVHIVPVPAGAGGKGGAKIIVGLALIALTQGGAMAAYGGAGIAEAAVAAMPMAGGITFGQVAAFGAMLAISGVANMLSPQPKVSGGATAQDQKPSYYFNGPVNVNEQGGCVPLVYGRCRVGSTIISSGLSAEAV